MCKKLIFLFCLILGGCSFQPLYYQEKMDLTSQTAAIDILPVAQESGRILVNKLKDLLNPENEDVEKKYSLSISLKESIDDDQGILGDNTSTRATMRITANFTLKEGQKVLLQENAFSTSSYNVLMLPYPTVTAENTTRKRLLEVLANNISIRLAVFFKKENDK